MTCTGRRRWCSKKRGGNVRVGLADGRIVPLTGPRNAMRSLKLYDAVYVRVTETQGGGVVTKGKNAKAPPPAAARAELRVRPTVQGAAVVLENKTGRILAMAGGFSYPLSQLNRVTQSQRQPGSAIKPLSYLAALAQGAAAQYAGARRADHAAADRRCQRPHPPRGLLDAEEL